MNYQGHLLAASPYNGLLLEQGSALESAADAAHASEPTASASHQ